MPMGEWRYSPMHQVKVKDQLQAPAALPPREICVGTYWEEPEWCQDQSAEHVVKRTIPGPAGNLPPDT
jgi:hypothetical protein